MATITNSICTNNKEIDIQSSGGALNIGTASTATVISIGNATGASQFIDNAGTAASSITTSNGSFT